MDELQDKYKKDTLALDEFVLLRDKVNALTDEQLAKQLFEDWVQSDIDTSQVDSDRIHALKEKIDTSIGRNSNRKSITLGRIGRIAVAVLLPFFILSTLYFYKQTRLIGSEEMIVTTGVGERANITLPDGTNVSLNFQSRLAYLPKEFNKKQREITFKGEAYFQVHKNAKCPFLINAKGLKIKVLGTVFNLHVRDNETSASLALEEGSVLFLSDKTHKNEILEVGSMGILDQKTGDITVIRQKNIENAAAWKAGYLKFEETELSEVINNIESSYGVNIEIDKESLSDLFTGTLPSNNLNEALLILEKSYHLKRSGTGNKILLTEE